MATAYAALTSLMNVIDQIQSHPRPPIYLPQRPIESLIQTVSFLQEFLEAGYTNQVASSSEEDPLEMRIADAAHAVEDVIESHIVAKILPDGGEVSSIDLHESVQSGIDEMEVVMKEAMDVKKKIKSNQDLLSEPDSSSLSSSAGSSSSGEPEQYHKMVGFDAILLQLLDRLTSEESSRQILLITGMGGIGKSTLAMNVYLHRYVVEYFDIRAWVTISQQYKIRKVLVKILEGHEENLSQLDENEFCVILYKRLYGRRYLIIMDDIWDTDVFDQLRHFLPDNNNGSRIVITTRLSNLARQIDSSHDIEMPVLDENDSWKLFCKHVFKEDDCPIELQEKGKRIVKGCKGLPLSISVVGGLLAKSKKTPEYWEEIAENVNSTVNNEHGLQVLYTSYYNLPVHLKPYFLFMGVNLPNSEDFISIKFLVAIFIAERFVKPVSGISLEEAAIECVAQLVERNLILIDKTGRMENWMYKDCMMHDLLRDLCFRECRKQKFIYVVGDHDLDYVPNSSIRRICVAKNTREEDVLPLLASASLLRSLWSTGVSLPLTSIRSRLLRVAVINGLVYPDDVEKVNMRIVMMDQYYLSSMSRFWNLQTFWVVDQSSDLLMLPFDIWIMSQLRSIVALTPTCFPDPPAVETDDSFVLENLHTLIAVYNFKCSEEIVKRIPNIKHLEIHFPGVEETYISDFYLNNIFRLEHLETLEIEVRMQSHIMQNQNLSITFPLSLIKLKLSGTSLHWDDVNAIIGSLPHLRSLQLSRNSCIGAIWETMEGQFDHLKFLKIDGCPDLESWMTESNHFPRLEILCLDGLHKLVEIPLSVGDIPTLQRIELEDCCESVYHSARMIKREQELQGNEDLLVKINPTPTGMCFQSFEASISQIPIVLL